MRRNNDLRRDSEEIEPVTEEIDRFSRKHEERLLFNMKMWKLYNSDVVRRLKEENPSSQCNSTMSVLKQSSAV